MTRANFEAMSNTPIKVAVCGAGSRGRTVYGRYALDNPDKVKVVAVAEPLEQRRTAFAAEHGIESPMVFSHWEELAAQPKLAQVAVVSTNDHDHVEPAVAFLESGYHLLLEKPMAPDIEGCKTIVRAAEAAEGMSAVCHVLRYTPYFRKLKELIQAGAVGRPITVRHMEPVNFWHFAHSFVRGNWRDSKETSPFILAKCCHDMDILLYLLEQQAVSLQSFGSLSHFRPQSAPQGAAARCLDCSVESSCPYSAKRFYGELLQSGQTGWPVNVLADPPNPDTLQEALRQGPYGRCVYDCDNDVCDHQVVQVEFEDGATAAFTATAFTDKRNRETEVLGTHGSLRGDGENILIRSFLSREDETITIKSSGHHLGGDDAMLDEFFEAVASGQAEMISTSPTVSLQSHLMALSAERSRLTRETIALEQLSRNLSKVKQT